MNTMENCEACGVEVERKDPDYGFTCDDCIEDAENWRLEQMIDREMARREEEAEIRGMMHDRVN